LGLAASRISPIICLEALKIYTDMNVTWQVVSFFTHLDTEKVFSPAQSGVCGVTTPSLNLLNKAISPSLQALVEKGVGETEEGSPATSRGRISTPSA
jgi:hypothetical protein